MKPLAVRWGLLPFLVSIGWGCNPRTTIASIRTEAPPQISALFASSDRMQRSRQLYQAGDYSQAAEILQEAADAFAREGNNRARAVALSNLSLAYQQLGEWVLAQRSIALSCEAIALNCQAIETLDGSTDPLVAQILQVRAQQQLAIGQAESALAAWKQAAEIYHEIDDEAGQLASQINQAQALQALGLYRQALEVLGEMEESLRDRPDSALKAQTLLGLGNTLRVVGKLEAPESKTIESGTTSPDTPNDSPQNQQDGDREYDENYLNASEVLSASFKIAERMELTQIQAKAALSLGNTAQSLAQIAKEFENNDRYENELDTAMKRYVEASGTAEVDPQTRIDAQLNKLRLWVEEKEWGKARELIPQLHAEIDRLPPGRFAVDARVNLAQSAIEISQSLGSSIDPTFDLTTAQILQEAIELATRLRDRRAQSFALGTLGKLYQFREDWDAAREVTQKALGLSQAIQASDISYQWQLQLGQILKVQLENTPPADVETKYTEAIAAYGEAVTTLQSLRGDLAAVAPDLQFSFRESVEPIYREFVELLLQPPQGGTVPNENLKLARDAIEALQLAELDNFFREACIDANPEQIDNVDPKAAVIYSIVIDDRLEVIAALPDTRKDPTEEETEPILLHHTQEIVPATLDSTVFGVGGNTRGRAVEPPELDIVPDKRPKTETAPEVSVRSAKALATDPSSEISSEIENLTAQTSNVTEKLSNCYGESAILTCYGNSKGPFQDIYDWLIRPIEAELAASQVDTLVFVLDGVLRNVPMSVLHDGEQYLIEKYAIAITPGLQLLSVDPIQEVGLTTLAAGLSNMPEHAKEEFSDLDWVDDELNNIEEVLTERESQRARLNQKLLDDTFTTTSLQNNITAVPSAIVHLATHGQFSSNADDTFLLAHDRRIQVESLNRLLRSRDGRKTAIELLILSACQTAVGDDRAALGLAGFAVRAGARSTVASLWAVDDRSTALLMERFYQELVNDPGITKAQALRSAQLSLLRGENGGQFTHPVHWAAFVLVGNWQ
ncbi:MAG: CHAT domain-containing protein [Cyanobacteriota bacterium]|nr:CHAT domain-containing protein [Cyanobacteriota bacterium]